MADIRSIMSQCARKDLTSVRTYADLVGTIVFSRLYDKDHPEWQRCRVMSICQAGIKLKSLLTKEIFVIGNGDVLGDIRVDGAFIPWGKDQKPYDGKFCLITAFSYLLNYIYNELIRHKCW